MMCPTNDALNFGPHENYAQTKMLQEDMEMMVPVDKLRLSQRQTAQKELENERLAAQLKEVIGMNTRWQRYDQQREAYVLKLHAANKELLKKLTATQKTFSELQERMSRERLREERPDIAGVASPLKGGSAVAEQANHSHTAPMCALDAKFARKEKEVATLTDLVERLEEQVASLQRSATKRRDDEEERIALFKAQLEVCMEDFRQERSDRERMNGERLRLRKQLDETEMTITRLHQEITDLVEETRWLRDRPSRQTHHYGELATASSGPTHRYNYYKTTPSKPNLYIKRVGHGMDVPDYDSDSVSNLPSDVTVDGEVDDATSCEVTSSSAVTPTPPPVHGVTEVRALSDVDGGEGLTPGEGVLDCVRVPSGEGKPEKPLRCPQCLVEFAVDKHSELLRHIELCSGDEEASQDGDL